MLIFPNDFNNGMFGISKYFFLSKFLVFNAQVKSVEGGLFIYVNLTLVGHLISEKYVTFKCDKSF